MWKSVAILAAALAGLIWWDLALSRKEVSTRKSSLRVRQLLPPQEREGKLVAALRIEEPGQQETFYARSRESWRCLTRFGAPGEESKIRSLLEMLFSTQGIVQSREEGRAQDYGLGPAAAIRLTLHDRNASQENKSRGVIRTLEVGSSVPGANGCYVRLAGSEEVVAIDADLRAELARPEGADLPPLLDPHLIPGGWPANGSVQRIEVIRKDGEKYELLRREKKISPEDMKTGQLPWDWFLKREGKEELCPPGPSNGFAFFLQRAPIHAVLDPRTAPALGMEPPAARIALYPSTGEPLALVLGGAAPGGGTAVKNTLTGTFFEATDEVAGLLAPRAADLQSAEGQNPWDAFLRRPPPGAPAQGFPPGINPAALLQTGGK
jgi:hypothetical protein